MFPEGGKEGTTQVLGPAKTTSLKRTTSKWHVVTAESLCTVLSKTVQAFQTIFPNISFCFSGLKMPM